MKSRKESLLLLEAYIKNPSLKNHSLMVAHAMESYAIAMNLSENEVEDWWTSGLLHDLDWEQYPDEHPNYAVQHILPSNGYPEVVLEAIKAHAPDRTGKSATELIERYLFACDEICGFINAVSLIRPEKFKGMEVKSITKRLKEPRFAANVSREDIRVGADLIGKSLEDHIAFLLNAFQNFDANTLL